MRIQEEDTYQRLRLGREPGASCDIARMVVVSRSIRVAPAKQQKGKGQRLLWSSSPHLRPWRLVGAVSAVSLKEKNLGKRSTKKGLETVARPRLIHGFLDHPCIHLRSLPLTAMLVLRCLLL